jgi:hypothetical protein
MARLADCNRLRRGKNARFSGALGDRRRACGPKSPPFLRSPRRTSGGGSIRSSITRLEARSAGPCADEVASALASVGHRLLTDRIPLYSAIDAVHDYLVRVRSAFDETVLATREGHGRRAEVRVMLDAGCARSVLCRSRRADKPGKRSPIKAYCDRPAQLTVRFRLRRGYAGRPEIVLILNLPLFTEKLTSA